MPPANTEPNLNEPLRPRRRRRDRGFDGPPEEEFWDRYNRRMEFPLATVAAVFVHVVVGAVLVYVLVGLMDSGEDRSNPPLQLVAVGGLDDAGDGSAGSGGQADPDIVRDVDPFKAAKEVLPSVQALNDAKENIQKIVLDDPNGKLPIAAPNAAAYSQLDDSIRKKLLGVGAQKGDGSQPGKGFDGTAGAGPGGTGADSTRARGLRWVLRFRVAGGKDYVDQLRAMGAEILVPLPPDDKKCILIRDLNKPVGNGRRRASEADLKRLGGKIQFSDTRREPVREVIAALGVNVTGQPKSFWAFFPRELEDEARPQGGHELSATAGRRTSRRRSSASPSAAASSNSSWTSRWRRSDRPRAIEMPRLAPYSPCCSPACRLSCRPRPCRPTRASPSTTSQPTSERSGCTTPSERRTRVARS